MQDMKQKQLEGYRWALVAITKKYGKRAAAHQMAQKALHKFPDPLVVHIEARRWFNSHGNTHYWAKLYVDGVQVIHLEDRYGYGDQYQYEMLDAASMAGVKACSDYTHGQAPWRWAEENGVQLTSSGRDCNTKREAAEL